MIIDGHAHAAGIYATVDSILAASKEFGIEKVLLCTSPKNNMTLKSPPSMPVKNSPDSIFTLNKMLRFAYKFFMKDCGDGNRYVAELRNRLPDTVIPFLWVNPLDRAHMNSLESHLEEYHAKGIKLHQAWNPFSIGSPEFNRLIEIAKSRRLPVFIHLYSRGEAEKLSRVAAVNRDAVFICAHLLGARLFQEKGLRLENVYFDTSGSERIQGGDILDAVQAFGYDHVVFGSDSPYADIGAQIAKIDGLGLSDKEKEHIFELNITNVLAL
jgi:predicted TIM-barrel fold metal-dependent hydrolase